MPDNKIIKIHFEPMFVPAFHTETGDWLDYAAVYADGLQGLTVIPTLRVFDSNHIRYLQVSCAFDANIMPADKYGTLRGDEQFRSQLSGQLLEALPDRCAVMYFTYAGMSCQDDGLIVLEGGQPEISLIDSLSSHELIEIMAHPDVTKVVTHQ